MLDTLRNLYYMARRFRVATVLNAVGLTVALVAFYLFMTQVTYNAGYNRCFPNAERIMRVEAKMNMEAPWGINCNRPLLEKMAELPEVESGTVIAMWDMNGQFYQGETPVDYDGFKMSNAKALETFGVECVDGKLHWDKGEQGILIPASMARRFLGTEQAAGRFLWNGKDSIPIQGVYRNLPANCFLSLYKNDCIVAPLGDECLNEYSEWSYIGYLRLYEAVDAEAFSAGFKERVKDGFRKVVMADKADEYEHLNEEERAEWDKQFDDYFGRFDLRVAPLTETYFSGVSPIDRGNRTVHLILLWACVILIIVAAINFLNFTLAEAPMRVRGVNTRRVLGSTLWSLRLGLIGETVVTALLAFTFGMGVCYLLSQWPAITAIAQGSLNLGQHLSLIAWTGLLAVGVGIVAGMYPAWFVTSFQPALALKGSFGLTPRGRRLRTLLVCLQVLVSLVLVTYIGILYLQSHFIYHSDYGYDKDQIVYAQLTPELMKKKDAIRAEVLALGGVQEVSYSQSVLGSQPGYMGWGRGSGDKTVSFTCLPVDWRYLRTMGIKVVEGRDFTEHDGDCYIINETGRRRWNWVEMDKPLTDDDLPVVGVCENIRYASVHQDRTAEPVAFVILGERYASWGDRLGILNARLAAGTDKVQLRRQIEKKLTAMGDGSEVTVRFLDQILENLYQEEFRFIRQVLLFAVICLVITLIGVFCLMMFETEYRRKEIGIRKVMGSSTWEILLMFCRHYALLLVVSFVIAAPIAYYIGQQWLLSFAERTSIHWWLFPLALAAVSLITLGTVALQSLRAANENPINSIKNE